MKYRLHSRDLPTIVIALCAVVLTALVARRELGVSPAKAAPASDSVPNWREFATNGHLLGSPTAEVTIVEFADFECQYCARFATTSRQLMDEFDFNVMYRHFPLGGNRFSMRAIRAAECAGEQEQFEQMHDLLFQFADSFGVASWRWFAQMAEVSSLESFDRCVTSDGPISALAADTLAARKLGITGTPLLLIGARRIDGLPSVEQLRAELVRAGARRIP